MSFNPQAPNLRPFKAAARARYRSIYVWQADGSLVSSIHRDFVPWNVDYWWIDKCGSAHPMARRDCTV